MIRWRNLSWRRLAKDRSGVAAVEFAIVLPVMLTIYFGIVELVQAATVNRLVALTATTVTNIVSQYTTISASTQMPDILNAATQVLMPYPVAKASIVISCITIDSKGNATVTWSQQKNGTALKAGSSITVPAKLDIPNTTLLLGQVRYSYAPAIDFLSFGTFSLSSTVYMLPRNAASINLTS